MHPRGPGRRLIPYFAGGMPCLFSSRVAPDVSMQFGDDRGGDRGRSHPSISRPALWSEAYLFAVIAKPSAGEPLKDFRVVTTAPESASKAPCHALEVRSRARSLRPFPRSGRKFGCSSFVPFQRDTTWKTFLEV
jgi:hypothetical protein